MKFWLLFPFKLFFLAMFIIFKFLQFFFEWLARAVDVVLVWLQRRGG